jgi:hypothetical protein
MPTYFLRASLKEKNRSHGLINTQSIASLRPSTSEAPLPADRSDDAHPETDLLRAIVRTKIMHRITLSFVDATKEPAFKRAQALNSL